MAAENSLGPNVTAGRMFSWFLANFSKASVFICVHPWLHRSFAGSDEIGC